MTSLSSAPLIWVPLFVFAAAAGCVDSGGSSGSGASEAPTAAPPADFDEETGALSGTVTDSELQPLSGAELLLEEAKVTAVSAQDGTFAFSSIQPGTHTLLAARLGYSSQGQKVTVVAGEELTGVRVLLEPLAVAEARAPVVQFKGLIVCSIGHAGVLSEECGEGLGTPVGTFGKNERNKIDWKYNVEDTKDLKTSYLELDWQPASPAAQQLAFNVAHGFSCTPGCAAKATYCGAFNNYGRPVQDCEVDEDTLSKFKPLPWDITARAWAAPVPATSTPNIVLEQPFDMWRTDFFGEAKPENYSAVPDK